LAEFGCSRDESREAIETDLASILPVTTPSKDGKVWKGEGYWLLTLSLPKGEGWETPSFFLTDKALRGTWFPLGHCLSALASKEAEDLERARKEREMALQRAAGKVREKLEASGLTGEPLEAALNAILQSRGALQEFLK
jgi:hypothetical protein